MLKIFLSLAALIILTSCVTDTPAPIVGIPNRSIEQPSPFITASASGAIEDDNHPMPIAVLHYAKNAMRSVYEPADGIYLAAWLTPHTTKREFVQQTGQDHAAFVRDIHIGDDIPVTWIIQCIAVMATPIFIVHPPRAEQENDPEFEIWEQIAELAQQLGGFNLPMFVAFYPPVSGHGLIPAEYSFIFRYARSLFLSYAPQVAFVWVAPALNSTIRNPFFPGSDVVDWVGVSLFASRGSNGLANVIEAFTPFYHRFQAHHPIMVLPLGVSHFSRYDHAYNIADATAEIMRIYQALAGFPRVGLIAYGDVFGINPTRRDDFSITIDNRLMAAYSEAVANSHFVSSLETNTARSSRWVRSEYVGYVKEGRLYIDINTLAELSITTPRNTTEINERSFVEVSRITGRSVSFCEIRNVIKLY